MHDWIPLPLHGGLIDMILMYLVLGAIFVGIRLVYESIRMWWAERDIRRMK